MRATIPIALVAVFTRRRFVRLGQTTQWVFAASATALTIFAFLAFFIASPWQ